MLLVLLRLDELSLFKPLRSEEGGEANECKDIPGPNNVEIVVT